MDDTQGSITVFYRINDNSDREEIVDLVKSLVLVAHLLVDTKEVLDSSVNVSLNTCVRDALSDIVTDLFYVSLTLALPNSNFLCEILVYIRLKVFK